MNFRLLLLGSLICAVAAGATPYVTLKLGMSVDLSFGGMFLAAALLGRHAAQRQLAVQLNLVQTMINVVSGIGFMVVILAAFQYIQVVFGRDVGFHPTWWQIAIWLWISANLGVFMGALPRRMILDDKTLPWPTGQALLSVADTLSDPSAKESTILRRGVLTATTALAAFVSFLKDGLGVIAPIVGNASIAMMLSLELAGIGFGMLVPLAVGLSGLLGVWFIQAFGKKVATLVALNGTAPEHWAECRTVLSKGEATEFLTANCGKAAEFLGSGSHFKYIVQWMMWPATSMMVMAAVTSVVVPLAVNAVVRRRKDADGRTMSKADERVPWTWMYGGIAACVAALVWLQDAWFAMPWYQVLVAVAIQPILIVAGIRVLGITGQGPVSLMANATQFVFGLLWPGHVQQNLVAAHVAADPQASGEATMASFWVARRLGGSFQTLILAQLIMIPVGAIVTPIIFNLLQQTYGIGTDPGQLSAPTGLKIASLAIIMEQGLSALPRGAFAASIAAAVLGIALELLLMMRRRDADGTEHQRFAWLPIPSAFGFALILPPAITIAIAVGSVISAFWRKFSPKESGSYALLAAPLAAGLIAGEAVMAGILLPFLAFVLELLKPLL